VCAVKQDPVSGVPQDGPVHGHAVVCVPAIAAHAPSHWVAQQNASTAQTASQHTKFLQAGPGCWMQQFPASGSPHSVGGHADLGPILQIARAAAAQLVSHKNSQQNESSAQTSAQHLASLHEVNSCGRQQSPAQRSPQSFLQEHSGDPSASSTQYESHAKSRQKFSVSNAHTASQQAASRHFGESKWMTQQSPAFSSPHSKVEPQFAMSAWACAPQDESQLESQQNGSLRQIAMQQRASAHPEVPCPIKQEPDSTFPQPVAQRRKATLTQNPSQPNEQQDGSSAHTAAQQNGLSQ